MARRAVESGLQPFRAVAQDAPFEQFHLPPHVAVGPLAPRLPFFVAGRQAHGHDGCQHAVNLNDVTHFGQKRLHFIQNPALLAHERGLARICSRKSLNRPAPTHPKTAAAPRNDNER